MKFADFRRRDSHFVKPGPAADSLISHTVTGWAVVRNFKLCVVRCFEFFVIFNSFDSANISYEY